MILIQLLASGIVVSLESPFRLCNFTFQVNVSYHLISYEPRHRYHLCNFANSSFHRDSGQLANQVLADRSVESWIPVSHLYPFSNHNY